MKRALLLLFIAAVASAQSVITTIAGTDWLFPGDGGPALEAPLAGGINMNVAVDNAGNYYITDADNVMVMRVTPDGTLEVVAGNGIFGYSGDGGPANAASLSVPIAVAVDGGGNVFISDYFGVIRKVSPDGIITTVAGRGRNGFSGDGGPAVDADFNIPGGLAVDLAGNLYVADTGNHRVRKITAGGIITTIAGTGEVGASGDGGPAVKATLDAINGIAVDAAGNIYLAITNADVTDLTRNAIRKIAPDGTITTIAGGGRLPFDNIRATTAFIIPVGVAVDSGGNVYLSDFFYNRVRKITTDGMIDSITGISETGGYSGDEGPAKLAELNTPIGVAVDGAGAVYIGDGGNARVRLIAPDGIIHTVAGNGRFRSAGDGGPATSAALYLPTGIATDASGNLYISEQFRHRVRKVAPGGAITVFAGTEAPGYSGDGGPAGKAALDLPSGVAADARGNVYIADTANSVIRKVTPAGIISTVAGNGKSDYSGDNGPATSAALFGPKGVAVDAGGNLYIADSGNGRVRKVDASGIITTLAMRLSDPRGIAVDARGNVFVSEYTGHRVRRIAPDGTIATVAGNGRAVFAGDDGPATSASLRFPLGLTLDAAGNLYIADSRNFRIRQVSPSGVITTVVGNGFTDYAGDGGPAAEASLAAPFDVTFDRRGNLVVADTFNHRVRAVLATPPSFQAAPAALTFSAQAGAPPTPAQTLRVNGSIAGILFSPRIPADAPWLTATPEFGNMPAAVAITADASQLSPGEYQATITVVAPYASPPTMRVAVRFSVSTPGPARLSAKADALAFSFFQRSAASTQTLAIANDGGTALDFTVAAGVSKGAWLSAAPTTGTLAPFSPASLTVTANPAGLAPGTYNGAVSIVSSSGEQRDVPVSLTVSAIRQSILLLESGLTFTAVAGAGVTPPQPIGVANIGQGVMNWTATASTLSGGASWLAVDPASDSSNAGGDVPEFKVRVDPSGLRPGEYYGQVQVDSPTADNSPQLAVVVLNVLPPGSDPGPVVQPAGLVFTGTAGMEPPGSQTITITNLDRAPETFTSGRITVDGADWFVHLPAQGTIAPGQSARIVVQPNTRGLSAGVYQGKLTLLLAGGISRTVSIVFVVSPNAAAASGRSAVRHAAGCAPNKLLPVFTSLGSDVNLSVGWPNRITVRAVDDCGSAMVAGSVVAQFSNNDPPLVLTSLKNGEWRGTWQSRNAASQVTIKATAEIPDLQLKGTAEVTAGLQPNQDPPVLKAGGIVSAASLAQQAPIAPGSLISIFGTRLADAANASAGLPWQTQLGTTRVAIAGRPIPLKAVSEGRIDAVLPYDLPVNTRLQVAVQRGSSSAAAETLTIAPSAPAIFTRDSTGAGQGMIFGLASDGTPFVAAPGSPVHAGDRILVQCTGLGAVTPAVDAGTAAPEDPEAQALAAVSVNVAGMDAKVESATLQVGLTGIYLVTATVPAGVSAGDEVPVTLVVGGVGSPVVSMAVR